jgi:hypothetical protein
LLAGLTRVTEVITRFRSLECAVERVIRASVLQKMSQPGDVSRKMIEAALFVGKNEG